MTYFYIHLLTCAVCLLLAWYFRHNMADTRGQFLVIAIVACTPVLNVTIVCGTGFFIFMAREKTVEWLKKPLKAES